MSSLLHTAILCAALHAGAPQHSAHAPINSWIDTIRYEYLGPNPQEIEDWRNDERRYMREKSGKLCVRPSLYPSPIWSRPDVV